MQSEPIILAFDTSAAHCAAALLRGGTLAATRAEEMGRGQAERLFPMLDSLLNEAGSGWRDLAAIAVGTGPGNFTGIRISVAAARGLALALGVPAIGVTRFEALAMDRPRPVTAVVGAPRDMVYAQRFNAEPESPALVSRDGLAGPLVEALSPERLASAIAVIAAGRLGRANPRPTPLYIRPADAAPTADPPPVILR